jgi:hypothetical protein
VDFDMIRKFRMALLLSVFLALVLPLTALAHGRTEVGDYQFVIGFRVEPAYAGEPNGLDLFVTNKNTEEPVNGLEETLQVEIIHGASKQELEIRTQFGQDGAYTADVLPTEAGDYTWHIWGDVEGTPVDITMTSSPDTFSAVRSKSEVSFPAAEPTVHDLQAEIQRASTMGLVGAILGGLSLVVSLVGFFRKHS